MDLRRLRRSWLGPLVFFQGYLSLTILLFFLGPWPWDIDNWKVMMAYLVGAQVSIAFGYMAAWPRLRKAHLKRQAEDSDLAIREGLRFTRAALVITLMILIPTSISRTGSLVPDIASGLVDTGAVYDENYERLESGNPFVVVEYLRIALSPWLVGLFPVAIVYWGRMSVALRVGCVAAVLGNLSLYIATGTNKGLADIVVTGPWLVYLAVVTGALRSKVSIIKVLLLFGFLIYGFLQFFANSQLLRGGNVGESGVFETGRGIIQADVGVLGTFLSDNSRIIFESLTRYVVQGYHALSMSMQVEHSSTLGFGHSIFLARNANAVFGTTYFSEQSLPGLVEAQFGWSMLNRWHSIYSWLASDFGFVGSILVVGLLAYLLSLSWGMSLSTMRYRWLTLMYLMLILFYYIPANNQVFQSADTCVGFFLVLCGLLWSKPLRPAGASPAVSPRAR